MGIYTENQYISDNIILRKALMEDTELMYENVWSDESLFKYMFYEPTFSLTEAFVRMYKTVCYQKENDAFLICQKDSNKPIGFCGMKRLDDNSFIETGICIGKKYQNKGYGKEALLALIDIAIATHHATKFYYATCEKNIPSIKLVKSVVYSSVSFQFVYNKSNTCESNNKTLDMEYYLLDMSKKIDLSIIDNYFKFKEYLKLLDKDNIRPSILLHSCCGPCSTSVLKILVKYFDVTIYYYNPNIDTKEEFNKRVLYQKEVIDYFNKNFDMNQVKLIVEEDSHDVYHKAIKGCENLKEGSTRCYKCYEFRIKKLSEKASELGFDFFTSVMSVSPYKNSEWINELGIKYQDKAKYLFSDYKKESGYQTSIKMSKELGLYRQDYCGCEYSKKEHEERLLNKKLISKD